MNFALLWFLSLLGDGRYQDSTFFKDELNLFCFEMTRFYHYQRLKQDTL